METRIDRSELSMRQQQTWDRQEAFLAAYAECGSERRAAPASGINRYTARLWRKSDALGFNQRSEDAKLDFREALQDLTQMA